MIIKKKDYNKINNWINKFKLGTKFSYKYLENIIYTVDNDVKHFRYSHVDGLVVSIHTNRNQFPIQEQCIFGKRFDSTRYEEIIKFID